MQAFLLYIDDWISSKNIELMDAAEERGYLRLLMRAAKEPDCRLPDDDVQLSIMSMLGPQWYRPTADKNRRVKGKTSGQKLRDCFVLNDGKLLNVRLYREFENQQRVREARSQAGSLGGRPKKQLVNNSLSNGKANEKQTDKQMEPIARRDWVLRGNNSEDFELRFDAAFSRHKKNRGTETKNIVAQILIGHGVSWDVLEATHIPFCAYWDRRDWAICPVSFLEWFRNGMPGPPPEVNGNGSRAQRIAERG